MHNKCMGLYGSLAKGTSYSSLACEFVEHSNSTSKAVFFSLHELWGGRNQGQVFHVVQFLNKF